MRSTHLPIKRITPCMMRPSGLGYKHSLSSSFHFGVGNESGLLIVAICSPQWVLESIGTGCNR